MDYKKAVLILRGVQHEFFHTCHEDVAAAFDLAIDAMQGKINEKEYEKFLKERGVKK